MQLSSTKSRRWSTGEDDELPTPIVRVLLAEDDPELRHMVASVLADTGFEVFEAGSGGQLLEWIRKIHGGQLGSDAPDLIVTDLCMPGASGLEGLSLLRQSDWTIPVVVMTAYGDEDIRAEARRLGAALVLDKPFGLDELRRSVESLVGR